MNENKNYEVSTVGVLAEALTEIAGRNRILQARLDAAERAKRCDFDCSHCHPEN